MFGPAFMPTGSTISSTVIRDLRIDKVVLADKAKTAPIFLQRLLVGI